MNQWWYDIMLIIYSLIISSFDVMILYICSSLNTDIVLTKTTLLKNRQIIVYTSAVLHVRYTVRILYVYETNTYENVLEVFVSIHVRIFAYVFVRTTVRTAIRIFVRIWTYTVCICTYPSSYLHVSQSVSARIPVHICTYPSLYLHVS